MQVAIHQLQRKEVCDVIGTSVVHDHARWLVGSEAQGKRPLRLWGERYRIGLHNSKGVSTYLMEASYNKEG